MLQNPAVADRRPVAAPARVPDEPFLVPVVSTDARRSRPVGAYAMVDGRIRFVPAVDRERIVFASLATASVAVLGLSAALATRRHGPAIGAVSMGPGGWVSVKGAAPPPLRPDRRRPWWARLLRARRLVVE